MLSSLYSSTCDGSISSRRQLPVVAAAVIDEMQTVLCSNCRTFETPPMTAGEVLVFEFRIDEDRDSMHYHLVLRHWCSGLLGGRHRNCHRYRHCNLWLPWWWGTTAGWNSLLRCSRRWRHHSSYDEALCDWCGRRCLWFPVPCDVTFRRIRSRCKPCELVVVGLGQIHPLTGARAIAPDEHRWVEGTIADRATTSTRTPGHAH